MTTRTHWTRRLAEAGAINYHADDIEAFDIAIASRRQEIEVLEECRERAENRAFDAARLGWTEAEIEAAKAGRVAQ